MKNKDILLKHKDIVMKQVVSTSYFSSYILYILFVIIFYLTSAFKVYMCNVGYSHSTNSIISYLLCILVIHRSFISFV